MLPALLVYLCMHIYAHIFRDRCVYNVYEYALRNPPVNIAYIAFSCVYVLVYLCMRMCIHIYIWEWACVYEYVLRTPPVNVVCVTLSGLC